MRIKNVMVDFDRMTVAKMLKLADKEGLTLSQWVDKIVSKEIGPISLEASKDIFNS